MGQVNFVCVIAILFYVVGVTPHRTRSDVDLTHALETLQCIFLVEYVLECTKKAIKLNQKIVTTGIRTQNLLLRRQAPYPLGHSNTISEKVFLFYTTETNVYKKCLIIKDAEPKMV